MSEAEQPASTERVALGRLLWLGPLVVVGSVALFRIFGVVALRVSFLPDIALLVTRAMPGTSVRSVAVLMFLHVVAAAITLVLLTTLAREPRAQG